MMRKLPLLLFCIGSVALGASHSIDGVQANPSSVVTNTSTDVLITATITDPDLIPASVNLLSVTANGTVTKIIGSMHDEGQEGDATAGDHIYTLKLVVEDSVAENLYYRVSAAFKGSITRVLSGVILVGVWNQVILDNTPITVNAPPQWSVQPVQAKALFRRTISNVQHFSPIDVDSLQNESQFEISVRQNANPNHLAIGDWFNSQSSRIGVPILSVTTSTVGGQNALRVELDEIQRRAHYYVATKSGDVIEIVFSLEQPNFLAEYQAILQSLQLP